MSARHFAVLPKTLLAKSHGKGSLHVAQALLDAAAVDAATAYSQLQTRPAGLSQGSDAVA